MDRTGDPEELLRLLGGWMSGQGPLYGKLARALHRAVRAGDLGRGERLPSERALARALSVSRATVVAAYDELRGLGVVESRRGSGTRIAARPPGLGSVADGDGTDGRVPGGRATTLLQRMLDGRDGQDGQDGQDGRDGRNGRDGTISLATTAEPAADEVREALRDVQREDLAALLGDTGYHPRGLPALREAVARRLTALGLSTSAAQVLVTTGATQALGLVAQLYVRKGDVVVVESPSWPGCLDLFRAVGAVPHQVPLDEDGMRVDGLAEALARRGPALVTVTPTYHNPTGTLMSAHRRRRVAALCAERGVPVLEDLAYDSRTAADREEPPPLAAFAGPERAGAGVLTVGSLAKSVWAGLRIGWVRGPQEAVERLARLKALADLGCPVLDQALAARLLPRLDAIRAERAEGLRHGLAHLEGLLGERLPEWKWRTPDGGSALWVRLPYGTDARVYAQLALRYGVELVPGAATDPDGAHDDHIRIPCALPEATLTDLVHRLDAAWRSFH
ncbi:PLP-dependent aminotransferase family protein [Streptomyces sp. NPDC048172]|uniref:aminotransferase-like domain-containing protein n=1 Tax=Streptomyces sp. NPDC048172 TaxID=3365505 RepID=UPI00371489A6